ncbi:peptidoglycan-binding protein, partial [Streptomyces sp. Act-28]
WRPMADRLAGRFRNRGEALEDLRQVAALGLVVAVAGTAVFASGLFDGVDTADWVVLDPNPSAPPWPTGPADPTPGESAPPSRTASSAPSATSATSATSAASAAASSSPSASSSPTSAEAGRGATSPGPTASRLPEVRATASVRPRPADGQPSASDTGRPQESGPPLRRGAHGEEVLELQYRLRGIALYDDAMHGRYDKTVERAVARYQARRGITADPSGVYGPATREALEAETSGDR